MRKVLISLAVAASALTVAAPASAQYQQPYNNGHRYHDQRTQAFMYRIDSFRNDIRQFDREGRLSNREAARLDRELMQIRNQVMYSAQNGMSSRENRLYDDRLDRLRSQMRAEMRDGNRRPRRY